MHRPLELYCYILVVHDWFMSCWFVQELQNKICPLRKILLSSSCIVMTRTCINIYEYRRELQLQTDTSI